MNMKMMKIINTVIIWFTFISRLLLLILQSVDVKIYMPPNTDQTHDKYLWTTTSNFSQSTS